MPKLIEGNLELTIPNGIKAYKFDKGASHGLSHCMKAVDFIIEEKKNLFLFVEFKDPDHPQSNEEEQKKFQIKFESGKIDEDLKYKYRDSFLYLWATGKINKRTQIFYLVLIASKDLGKDLLLLRMDALKSKLPIKSPIDKWKFPIVTDAMIFNIETWNEKNSSYPVKRKNG